MLKAVLFKEKWLPLLLLSLLITGCGQSTSSDKQWRLEIFDPATNTSRLIQAADTTNKLIVINYWAEWCKPCIAEMPELNRFAAAHQDKIIMLSVNFDNKKEGELQAAIQKVGVTFPAITNNPATIFVLPEINSLPTTLILDEHGVLKKTLLGPQTFESLIAHLELQ